MDDKQLISDVIKAFITNDHAAAQQLVDSVITLKTRRMIHESRSLEIVVTRIHDHPLVEYEAVAGAIYDGAPDGSNWARGTGHTPDEALLELEDNLLYHLKDLKSFGYTRAAITSQIEAARKKLQPEVPNI